LLTFAACGLLVPAAPAKPVKATISIKFNGSDYGDNISGKVAAKKAACKTNRPLTLYRNADGTTKPYTSTTASQSGVFRFDPKGQVFQPGTYFARAPKRVAHAGKERTRCKAAASRSVVVSAQPARG